MTTETNLTAQVEQPQKMSKKEKSEQAKILAPATDDVNKTVDGVEVYEPHKHFKTRHKASDVVYGMKKPCVLADGTMPEIVSSTSHNADGE